MELISKSVLYAHILAGSISLVLFWLPVVTKKGGHTHNRMGRWYVTAMWVVVISALVLSLINILEGQYAVAAFLGFLSILTCTPLWYAKAILKFKKGISKKYFHIFKTLHTVVFLMGVALIIWSVMLKVQGMAVLLLIFGIIGVTNLPEVLRGYSKTRAQTQWLPTHLRGMLTTGIAAYTAFFAFGGRQLLGNIFTDYWMVVPWVLPTIIGTIGINYGIRRYSKPKVTQRTGRTPKLANSRSQ